VTEPPELERLLAPEGYLYASTPPLSDDDPGRYHALFGRDSLISALQLMPARPDIARATLRALAALQGRADDALTEEQPGKIVHEHRHSSTRHLEELGWGALFRDGELRYYGSADSTSWFLVVLASLDDSQLAAELEPAWRAAGGWLERALERGGGLVRYGPGSTESVIRAHSAEPSAYGVGLAQQGWRDAEDPLDPAQGGSGILRDDGTLPEPPLADADCQAVALVALRGLAQLSGEAGPRAAADRLQGRIEAAFGPETMAREASGAEVRGAGSQLGWLLWAGALGEGAAAAAADRLTRPDVLTRFGVRTLSNEHAAFGPHNYHRGSVWPFDSWLCWGGLRATGRHVEAERVRSGVIEAVELLGGAPELYAVTAGGPETIALANRVQAWTVGARWALENDWDGRVLGEISPCG
jgi:glycogen debranching enzyme